MNKSEDIDLVEKIMNNWTRTHGDTRSAVLTMHVCLEYRINKVIEKNFSNPDALDRLRFSDKIRVLDGLGVIDSNSIKNLRILNESRNFFAHDFDVDSEEFEKKFLNKMKELSFYDRLGLQEPVYAFNVFAHATMEMLRFLHLAKDEPVIKKESTEGNT